MCINGPVVNKTFKTAKGTEIPISDIKGKDYLLVPWRVVWFREEHPDWSIVTERIEATDKYVLFKATILNQDGRVIATAHKREDYAHFSDAAEKGETGAIGRALALCGFGTQFTQDFDEGIRLADSPIDGRERADEKRPFYNQGNPQTKVHEAKPDLGIPWSSEQKKEYCIRRWSISESKALTDEQKRALKEISATDYGLAIKQLEEVGLQ